MMVMRRRRMRRMFEHILEISSGMQENYGDGDGNDDDDDVDEDGEDV